MHGIITLSFLSFTGAEFEYIVENLNEPSIPQEIEELRERKNIQDANIASRSRSSGHNWKQDPPEKTYHHSTSFNAEIVSCTGFEGEKFFISYQITLPDGWKMRTGNLNDGYTEAEIANIGKDISVAREDGTKLTGSDILLNDGFQDGDEAIGILRGVTQVAISRQQRNNSSFTPKRR